MLISISLPSQPPLSFSNGLPQDYSGPVIPGGNACHASGNFGYVIVQELVSQQYTIRYQVKQFFRRIQMTSRIASDGLHTYLTLQHAGINHSGSKQTIPSNLNRISVKRMRAKHFSLSSDSVIETTTTYEGGKEYQSFEIGYSTELLNELVPALPKLYNFLEEFIKKSRRGFIHPSRMASENMLYTVQQILSNRRGNPSADQNYDSLVKDYLLACLERAQARELLQGQIQSSDLKKIALAREIIARDLFQHIPTVVLAKRVQLNEFHFKIYFKKVTGMGSYEYLLDLRLTKAYQLLTETDLPVKAIYTIVGYTSITGFIGGFRKRFGQPPGSIRQY